MIFSPDLDQMSSDQLRAFTAQLLSQVETTGKKINRNQTVIEKLTQAMRSIQLLYEIESEIRELKPDLRRRIRLEKAVPVMDRLHAWMIAQRELVHDGVAIAKTLDYSLKRWPALSSYLDDGAVPIDNNHIEQ